MERSIYNELLKWKDADNRKPLMLYGARQVGKTYIVSRFGEQEFEHFVYVNCYKNRQVEILFEGDVDVDRILLGLSAIARQPIEAGKTLLFLDEIQEIPPVVSALKYFCEKRPELHVVVAGSLLGVMNLRGESFPVGKVDILHLYPMTFMEFLRASGEGALADILCADDTRLKEAFAERYIELLRHYYFTGGMPEAVSCFCRTKNVQEVRQIQRNILLAYETDISKHTGNELQRVRMVWQSVPEQLARENKKFVYGAIRKGARAKDFEVAIQWLVDAGLVHKVCRVREAKIPLRFYADANAFKLYLLDVGLLGAMVEAPASDILIGNQVFSEYKGAFTENYVLQQLIASDRIPLFYYSKDNSTLEIDFVAQMGNRVVLIPIHRAA
ncbi:MAG: ATP-binding protein [Parabacteroides sp.]